MSEASVALSREGFMRGGADASAEASHVLAEGLFHSERDREIHGTFAERLEKRLSNGLITPGTYESAQNSLAELVPQISTDGKRVIAGKILSPAIEQRIASRLSSPEVNIAGPEGAWGRLPEPVKRELLCYGSELLMEMTENCTVGCSFCSLANKGPVAAKASFDSIAEVIAFYSENQDLGEIWRYDALYQGSDPFDAKWAATNTYPERDYSDIAALHGRLNRNRGRFLDTSTAVPVGEELRVLNYASRHLSEVELGATQNRLRFSVTRSNRNRVEHIMSILGALHDEDFVRRTIALNEVDDHIAIRGDRLNKPTKITFWDITGPTCRDGVIIGVHSVDGITMQGASPEKPSGQDRYPIELTEGGVRKYVIPHFARKPPLDGRDRPSNIYPDVGRTTLTIDAYGSATRQEETIGDDPHRILLRLAGAAIHYEEAVAKGAHPAQAEQGYQRYFGEDVRTLWRANTGNGTTNWVMGALLRSLIFPGSNVHMSTLVDKTRP